MRPVRRFYVGSHPCQGYRKTSYNGWDWGLLSTGSLKFRELEPDEANGEMNGSIFGWRLPWASWFPKCANIYVPMPCCVRCTMSFVTSRSTEKAIPKSR